MSSPAPKPQQHSGGSAFAKVRQVILLFFLLIAVCALGWEFLYIKPKVTKDYDALSVMRDENPGLSTEELNTDKTVQDFIGFAPSEETVVEDRKLEVYKYRRGIMVKYFTISCLYRKSGSGDTGVWFLADCYKNEVPKEGDWAAPRDENALPEGTTLDESPGGAGAAGGGGRRRSGRGGSGDDEGGSDDDSSDDDSSDDDSSDDDAKADDAGADDAKADDSKADDTKADDTSSDDSKGDDTSSDDKSGDDN